MLAASYSISGKYPFIGSSSVYGSIYLYADTQESLMTYLTEANGFKTDSILTLHVFLNSGIS